MKQFQNMSDVRKGWNQGQLGAITVRSMALAHLLPTLDIGRVGNMTLLG